MFFLKSPSNLDTLLNNNNTLYARPGKMQLINPRFSLQKKKQLTIWNDSRMTVTFFINYILWEPSVSQHPSSILSLAWNRPTPSIYLRSWKENPFKQFPFHFICKESGYTLIIFGSRISLDNFLDRVLIFKFLPSNKLAGLSRDHYALLTGTLLIHWPNHYKKQLIVASLYIYPRSRVPDIAICIS